MSAVATVPRKTARKAKGDGHLRRAEILEAALECFATRGFAATRMEDVAARAGVPKGTVYLYFPTKEELFKSLVRSELLPNLERLEAEALGPVPAAVVLERLLAIWAGKIAPSRIAVLPKLIIAGVVLAVGAGFYYSHQKEQMRLARLETERQIAAAKALGKLLGQFFYGFSVSARGTHGLSPIPGMPASTSFNLCKART